MAIIAYRQPITRGEIEGIRGVSVSGTIIKTLLEREWIKGVGHRDVPGKPELLVSTKAFLDYFNLKKLSDLPALAEIKDYDLINPDLFEALESEAKLATGKIKDDVDTVNVGPVITESKEIEGTVDETYDEVTIKEGEELILGSINTESSVTEKTDISEEKNNERDTEEGAKVIPFTN